MNLFIFYPEREYLRRSVAEVKGMKKRRNTNDELNFSVPLNIVNKPTEICSNKRKQS